MADDRINSTVTAAKALYGGLIDYGSAVEAVLTQARAELTRCEAHFQLVLVESQRRLLECQRATDAAQRALANAEGDTRGLAEALRRCQAAQNAAEQRVRRNRTATESLRRTIGDYRDATRAIGPATAQHVAGARSQLLSYAEDLNKYLARGGR